MTENNKNPAHFSVLTQYIKDLSFESPNSPDSLIVSEKQPDIQLNIELRRNLLKEQKIEADDIKQFEIIFSLKCSAKSNEKVIFHLELDYAGLFQLTNMEPEHIEPILHIEAPRLLFPFARQIVSLITQNGGLTPLWLEPIDFASLYYNKLQQQAESKPE